jgi:hypothetical protein
MKFFSINEKGDLIELNKLDFDNNQNVYLIDDDKKNTVFIWVGLDVPQYRKEITAAWARKFDKDRGGSCKILIMKQNREYGSFLAMMPELKKGLIPERRPELILEVPTEPLKPLFDVEAQDRPELILEEPIETPKPAVIEEVQEEKEDEVGTRINAWLTQSKEYRISEPQKPKTEPDEPVDKSEEPVDDSDEPVIIMESLGFEEVVEEEVEEVIEEDVAEEDEEEIGLESQIREAAYYLSLRKYSYNDLCWLLAETIQKINLGMPSLEEIRKKAEEVFNSSSTYDELCWLNAEMDLLIELNYLEQEKREFF